MKPRHLLMSVGIAALLAGAAAAQETTGDAATGTMSGDTATTGTATTDPGAAAPAPEFTSLEEMTVGDVLGMTVVSPDGETIGEIDYVVGDATGASAVIGIGGFLGLGEHTVALPLGDFDYDAEQRVLTLGTGKETLEEQPEFDESNAESLPEETLVADLIESDAAAGSDDASSDDANNSAGTAEEDAADDGSMNEESSAEEVASGDGSTSTEGSSEGDTADEGETEEEINQNQNSDG